jgi:hypothetical protein
MQWVTNYKGFKVFHFEPFGSGHRMGKSGLTATKGPHLLASMLQPTGMLSQ